MEKFSLNLDVLIPNLSSAEDGCIQRIKTRLEELTGIYEVHVKTQDENVQLCLHYDPSLVTLASLKRFVHDAGATISERYQHELLTVLGMDCSDCILSIEHTLKRIDGVITATVNYAAAILRIEYDTTKISKAEIVKAIRGLGYDIPKSGIPAFLEQKRELLFVLTAGIFLICGVVFGQSFPAISLCFYALSYLTGGFDVAKHALSALFQKHLDTDLLMIAAALGAAFLGEYFEGALLLFLFSLGHVLEEIALDKARNAMRELGKLTPKIATVRRAGKEEEISVEALIIDDVILIKPGSRIPADGFVKSGNSYVDQSSITGESVPVEKKIGETVFAGTINGEAALEVRVSKLSKDNTLSKVLQLVEEAQSQKTDSEKITEAFTKKFVPIVLMGDLIFVIIQLLFSVPFSIAFLRAMTVLVAASPCALALGTPSAMLCGIARAASKGVLIKGGIHLETLGKVEVVAFDKTGTLTYGKPEIQDVLVSQNEFQEEQIIQMAASAESKSGHPLAKAFKQLAKKRSILLAEIREMRSITGKGLQATVDERSILLGNLKLMEEQNVEVPLDVQNQAVDFAAQGKTLVYMSVDEKFAALFTLADTPRTNAKSCIIELKKLGIKETVLLTGDNEKVGLSMAERLGLDSVKAELMPQDKVTELKKLAQNRVIAMVGDGVNDAPALAASNVGIAMGGASTDVALETADVALMNDDLSKLPYAVSLGRKTIQVVKQNMFISSAVILLLLLASGFGLASIAIAVIIHEGSTLVVVANSLRLLRH